MSLIKETLDKKSPVMVLLSKEPFPFTEPHDRVPMQIQSAHVELGVALKQDQLVQSVKIGGIYQHYRGDKYKVIAVSRHSEDLCWYVVYEALYDNTVSKIWHRPLAMFLEEIDVNGVRIPRFKLIDLSGIKI